MGVRYRVTAEFVNVRVQTPTGPTVAGFYKDAHLPEGADEDHVKRLLDKGFIAEVEEPEPEPEPEDNPPAKSATKAEWVAYATDDARGEDQLSPDDAEALTRDQLAELFTS